MTQDRPKLPPLPESLRAWLFPRPIPAETLAKWKAQLAKEAEAKKEQEREVRPTSHKGAR